MKYSLLTIVGLITLAIVFYPQKELISKINGSPGAKTGSPLDGNNCTACHSGTANTGSGILSVATNIPVQGYTAGQTYAITVQIIQSSISRFGFEITCEEGNFGSAKTGSFGITDATTTKFVNNNTAVTHKQGGTSGSGSKTWSMNWTAPQTGVSAGVVFYVSANAANNNGNNNGDEVYTTSRPFPEAPSSTPGCTDSTATNYNPNATVDDGSCQYFNANCSPNNIYQDSTYNTWPDTIQNLPYGIVDSNYLTTLQIKTPSTLIEGAAGDTSLVTIDTLGSSYYIGGWPVDSFQIVNILGLPSGFSWSCSANNCMYNGDVVGCLDIFGNTTQITNCFSINIIS